MAEEKAKFEKQKQGELATQYQREQDILTNRALLGDEKAKMGLSFMYDAPPGAKQDREREDDEPEYKFEWQRKFNAPRESYAKGNEEIRDQPFGIEVRNVRCIKCHKWGHVNTDKICPLFGKNLTAEPPLPGMTPSLLADDMKQDGLSIKRGLIQNEEHQKMLEDADEEDPEVAFLKSLTPKQKKKLLKKLDKLHNAEKGEKEGSKKKKKKSKKRTHDGSESDSDEETKKRKKSKKSKRHLSDSESDSEEDMKNKKDVRDKRREHGDGEKRPREEERQDRNHSRYEERRERNHSTKSDKRDNYRNREERRYSDERKRSSPSRRDRSPDSSRHRSDKHRDHSDKSRSHRRTSDEHNHKSRDRNGDSSRRDRHRRSGSEES